VRLKTIGSQKTFGPQRAPKIIKRIKGKIKMNIHDTSNLTHLSDLVNKYAVNKNLDIDAIEKDMIGTSSNRKPNVSPMESYKSTLSDLQHEIGINIQDNDIADNQGNEEIEGEPVDSPVLYKSQFAPQQKRDEAEHNSHDSQEIYEDSNFLSHIAGPTESEPPVLSNLYPSPAEQPKPQIHRQSQPLRERYSGPPAPQYQQNYSGPQAPQYQQNYYQAPTPNYDPNRYDAEQYRQNEPNTQEQFNNVLQNYSGTQLDELSIKKEQEEDTKSILLEDIDEIKLELEDDNVDISRIPEVDQDSPLADVQKVHKMLRVKYIRRRYNDFGHEIILAGAQGLGYVFDGTYEIGPFKPNFNGWHNEVRTKLRRMRYETATIVSNVVQEYNIGPFSRLLFELIPSMVIYSNMKKNQHGQSNYSMDQVSQAISELRED